MLAEKSESKEHGHSEKNKVENCFTARFTRGAEDAKDSAMIFGEIKTIKE